MTGAWLANHVQRMTRARRVERQPWRAPRRRRVLRAGSVAAVAGPGISVASTDLGVSDRISYAKPTGVFGWSRT